jgi:hypothetical protein
VGGHVTDVSKRASPGRADQGPFLTRALRCVVTSVALNAVIWFLATVDVADGYADRVHGDPGGAVGHALSQLTLTAPVPRLAAVFAVTLTALLGMAILAHRGGGTWRLVLVAVVCINAVAMAVRGITDAVDQLPVAASILSVASVVASVATAALLLWWPSEIPHVFAPAEPRASAGRPTAVTRSSWLLVAGFPLAWLFTFGPNPTRATYHDLIHFLSAPHMRWYSVVGLVIAIMVCVAKVGVVALVISGIRAGRWWVRTMLALLGLFTIVGLADAAFHVLTLPAGAPMPGFGFAAGVLGRCMILFAVVSLFWPTVTSYFDFRIASEAVGRS